MKQKIRILMINDKGYKSGGTQVYTFELKRILQERGHNVRVLSSDINKDKNFLSDYYFKHFNNQSPKRIFYYLFNPYSYSRLKKVLKEFSPDIVHLNYIYFQSSPSVLFSLNKIPTVMTLHGSTLICPCDRINRKKELCKDNFSLKCLNCLQIQYPYHSLKYKIYKKSIQNIDKFIAISGYIKKDFIKNNYCNKDKIKVIHNCINLLEFSKIKNFGSLLYVGRLSHEKGVEYLVRSMIKIVKENRKIRLYIVGSGDEEKNLRQLVKKLNLERNILFLGEISYNKINKFYEKSSIVIVPSIWPEPFGLIGPEAMSVGRPVIASNVGGIPEWLEDGKTGFLVPPKDPDAIAEKVIYLLKRPKLMQKMGLAGRKKAEKEFDMKNYAKEIEKVYQEAIDKYRK